MQSFESSKPTVSVIIPVFNKKEYLSSCLSSVFNQTLKDIEVICINDGSTDGSLDLLLTIQDEYPNLIVINQANMGVAHSRNVGIDRATGEFICFMDPDDMYPDNEILKILYESAKSHNLLASGGSFSSLRDGIISNKYSGLNKKYIFENDGIVRYEDYQFDFGFQRFIFNSDMIKSNNISFPAYVRFQDPPFLTRALTAAGSFYAVSHPTYLYREAYKQLSWNLVKKIDLIRGLFDNIILAEENGFNNLKELSFSRLTSDNYSTIICSDNDKFSSIILIEELKNISHHCNNSDFNNIILHMINVLKRTIPDYNKIPSVSVVIPVYNVSNYLKECIDSVLNQTLENIQIICVDDGSTDDSGTICDEYAKSDERIQVIHKVNGGLSSARNRGADISTGKYLYFLDSDDMIIPTALEEMYGYMESYDLDALYFDADTLFESKDMEKTHKMFASFYKDRKAESKVMRGCELMNQFLSSDSYRTPVQLTFLNREFYERNNLNNYFGILHEDNLFTFECLEKAERAMYVNKSWYIRRIRGDSIITKKQNFRNFYGYSVCCYEMKHYLDIESLSESQIASGKIVLANTARSAHFVMDNLSLSESSKINSMTIDDKIKFAYVSMIDGSEDSLIYSQAIATTILNCNNSINFNILNSFLNQSLWENKVIVNSEESYDSLDESYLDHELLITSDSEMIERIEGDYVIWSNNDAVVENNFIGFALDKLRFLLSDALCIENQCRIIVCRKQWYIDNRDKIININLPVIHSDLLHPYEGDEICLKRAVKKINLKIEDTPTISSKIKHLRHSLSIRIRNRYRHH